MKKRILTGDRPTGKLHIGHYFGSLRNRVKYQKEYDTFIIIADVQALTDNFKTPRKVRENVKEVAIDNLAVGIDPQRSTIFIQSLIPEIAELTIFYSNLVTIARLERNPTVKDEFKQKKEVFQDKITYGFLGYPVSQAADITVFDADLVPVGDDQLPQVEQTQEIVGKFNRIYGKVLVKPEAAIDEFPRVRGLDGRSKMSKSLDNAIYLGDEAEEIQAKVAKALTDKNKIKIDDKGNPDDCTVFYYHQIFEAENLAQIRKQCQTGVRGCVNCKKELANNIIQRLAPIREKRKYYEKNPKVVEDILRNGTQRAKKVAQETLARVKKSMFLDYFK
ncbi:MAG: tryptophan--tRNA ligase [Candidatus Moranbacteria bacterium]|nr:tryptophan--tRNA ligase [Candidatus Moranbacteria bacterium]